MTNDYDLDTQKRYSTEHSREKLSRRIERNFERNTFYSVYILFDNNSESVSISETIQIKRIGSNNLSSTRLHLRGFSLFLLNFHGKHTWRWRTNISKIGSIYNSFRSFCVSGDWIKAVVTRSKTIHQCFIFSSRTIQAIIIFAGKESKKRE